MEAIPQQIKDAQIKEGNMLFKIKWEPQESIIQSLDNEKIENEENFEIKKEFIQQEINQKKQILQFENLKEEDTENKGRQGAIEFNDVPLKIKKVRRLDKSIEFIIEWKKQDGIKPLDSIVTSDQLKIKHKDFLFKFYESRFYFEEY